MAPSVNFIDFPLVGFCCLMNKTSIVDLVNIHIKLEQDMETVIKVLQPGPLGIIEHKFSPEEICKANSTVMTAVENWRRNAKVEQQSPIFKEFIDK